MKPSGKSARNPFRASYGRICNCCFSRDCCFPPFPKTDYYQFDPRRHQRIETMDKFLELKVIITFSIFVFFLIIERLLVYKEYKKKKRLISNFSLWFINGVSSYFIILPLTLFFTSLNFWERNTSVIQIVINLFVLDLWTYWWHRINHIIPFLWRFHLIHHLDEHLDVTSDS